MDYKDVRCHRDDQPPTCGNRNHDSLALHRLPLAVALDARRLDEYACTVAVTTCGAHDKRAGAHRLLRT